MKKTVDLNAALAAVENHEPASLTVLELVQAHDARNPTKAIQPHITSWLKAIGHLSAWAITTEQLQAMCNALEGAGYKAGYINRQGSALGSAYKWVKARHMAPCGFRSPTLGLVRLKEDMRVVECTAKEAAAIRAGAIGARSRRFGLLVALMMDSGARPSELLVRTWAELDLDKREIVLPTSKTDKPRVLFFTEETAKLARRLRPADTTQLVFPGRKGGINSFRRAWSTLRREIGRPDLRLYDLRHINAAHLLRAGNTLAVTAQVLGHSSLILHRRYGHLETKALREAQETAWAT